MDWGACGMADLQKKSVIWSHHDDGGADNAVSTPRVKNKIRIRVGRVFSGRVLGVSLAALAFGASVKPAAAQYVGHMSVFVADARTGAVLAQDNPDLQRYPASLTKLMTLYMTFKALRSGTISMDQAVPISIHAATREPSKLGLTPGAYLTVEQGVLGLVTKSANDAACALGELIGGGDEERFAEMMTAQAHALGMTRTTFRNASGLPDPEQVTTARDLGILAERLIADFPEDYHYFSVPTFYYRGREIPNHNPMLRFYPGADGMKTGYTAQAGLNLVTSAIRNDVRLVGVVMGASSSAERSRTMAASLDQGFGAEGVPAVEYTTPVPRPLILARSAAGRRRAMLMLAAASRGSRGTPLQVAEAPAASGKHKHSRLASVRLVSAHAPKTAAKHSHATHAAPTGKHSRSRT
ncbi:hypothetical protein ANI02nite_17520 [Acetobacter nitrogenifigens DSM 23921 = NBRC 105050]|uniref:Peptidase S11 D-alanyl-D-alanine carboxypeptidase A N-terminal domain-containing protein n=2 Tax=Acetobacter nitrogenifigens TaxID=285268 RepID=A0A511XAA0_9PROT|nr:hypothetical protein ANI02nite_17520 [Acetobacter nitrogenifigens DSM 23921 = NBRC 105050]